MDKMREEFEAFWSVERKNYRPHLGEDELFKEIALASWQAAKAQAVPQWIPVSERLPYDDELVLVYDSEGTHWRVYTLRAYKQFFDKFKCATHWMPLPKAPEQK